MDDDGGGGVGGGRCRRSGHWSRDEHGQDGEAGIGVGNGVIGSRIREHPAHGDDKRGGAVASMGEGDPQGRRHAGEQGGRRERAGQGGEGEAAAVVDANHQGQDGDAANGEKIWTTAKDK